MEGHYKQIAVRLPLISHRSLHAEEDSDLIRAAQRFATSATPREVL
jgi:hypothetical protein